jgi:hypothetical protein
MPADRLFGVPFRIFSQFRVKDFASRGWELERDFDVVPGRAAEDSGSLSVFSRSALALPVSLTWMSGRIAPNARRKAVC